MNASPVISLCIPAYRRSGFLKRLLDSIAVQTFTDFEIVLTDDSPDDEVAALVASHPLKERISYYKNPAALGTPENWNEGLRRAKGEWIKIMHDDDWFSGPDSLEKFAKAAATGQSSFYYSAYLNVLPEGKKELPFRAGNFLRKLNNEPEILLASNRIGPPSVVLFRARPQIFFDNRMKWLVDIDFYIHYLKNYPPAVYLPERLVNIGISESQVTQSSFNNPQVEIPERLLLGSKLGFRSIARWEVYDSWWRFSRNLNLRSEAVLDEHKANFPVPLFLKSIISFQKQIPPGLLKLGAISKMLMLVGFVMQSLKKSS